MYPPLCNTSLRFSLPLHHHQQQPLPKVRVEYSCGSVEYTTACSTLSEDSNKIPHFIDGHLGQGMGIIFEGKRMFIWEEVGRWPTRLDQVATLTYSWDSNQFLVLFIPAKYFVDDGNLPRSAMNPIVDNYAHVSGPFSFPAQFLIQNLTP